MFRNIQENNDYFIDAHKAGVPIKKLKNLQNNLFGLEANFEEFTAIDFKKGCYIGQENTARIKLKNKLSKRLLPIEIIKGKLVAGSSIKFGNIEVGKVLIDKPYPFALIKLFDPEFSVFKDQKLKVNNKFVEIIT